MKQCNRSLADLMNNHSKLSNKIKYVRSDLMEKVIKIVEE